MLTHEKDHCPSLDVRSRLQPQPERQGIFARMQAPQELSQRHNVHSNLPANPLERRPYVQRKETSSRHYAASGYGDIRATQKTQSSGDIRATHSDRIMRRRHDNRSNRYSGSRASNGPYDRYKKQAWREKVEPSKRIDVTSSASQYERND